MKNINQAMMKTEASKNTKPRRKTNDVSQYRHNTDRPAAARRNDDYVRTSNRMVKNDRVLSFSLEERSAMDKKASSDRSGIKSDVLSMMVEKMGINGEGIGHYKNKPMFIEEAFPGEQVQVSIIDEAPTFFRGKLKKIDKESPYRIREPYPVYPGHSYSLIQMVVEEQWKQKRLLVVQALQKYARVSPDLVAATVVNPVPFGYRNQLKMPFGMHQGKLATGMYMPNSNHFVAVENDIIHEPVLEDMRHRVMEIINRYEYQVYDKRDRKGLRTLVLRHLDGGFQCTLVSGRDNISNVMVNEIMALPGMVGVAHSINTNTGPDVFGKELRMLKGELTLPVRVNDLMLQVSCRSFFQLNTKQAGNLYQIVHDLLANDRYRLIIEAYSGVGGLGLSVRDLAKEVIGIESINSAVKNANDNASLNRASNVKFVLGDAGKEMRRLVNTKKNIDAVIVDPPRVGLSEDFIMALLDTMPKKIVYVSCNPSTLGKDLSVLMHGYKVEKVIPLDMFTHTAHVETVVLIEKK